MYMIFTIRQYDVLAENATPEEIDEMMKSYIVPLPVVIDEDLSLEEDEQMWNDEISSTSRVVAYPYIKRSPYWQKLGTPKKYTGQLLIQKC